MTGYRPPDGCLHCGIERPVHARQWADGVGWHGWAAPSAAVRQIRAIARRVRAAT